MTGRRSLLTLNVPVNRLAALLRDKFKPRTGESG